MAQKITKAQQEILDYVANPEYVVYAPQFLPYNTPPIVTSASNGFVKYLKKASCLKLEQLHMIKRVKNDLGSRIYVAA